MPAAGKSEQANLIPAAAAILLLILAAAFRFPYSFYALLRVTICLVSFYCASQAHVSKRAFWVWCFAASAIVFNPVIPLRMSRSDWRVLNIIDAVLFASWCLWLQAEAKEAPRSSSYQPLSAEDKEQVIENLRQPLQLEAVRKAKTPGKPQ